MMISAVFPGRYRALAMIGLYLFGILCGILYAVILKVSPLQKGEPVPFVMGLPELPSARVPKVLCTLSGEKAKGFIQKAFTHHLCCFYRNLVPAGPSMHAFNVVSMPESSLLAALEQRILHRCSRTARFCGLACATALITGTAKALYPHADPALGGEGIQHRHPVYAVYRGRISGIRAALHPCVAQLPP